jgi:hypothetical protein
MTLYAQIAPAKIITNEIIINEPTIIHFIPDFNTNFITYKDKFPFRLSNLQTLVVKSNMMRIGPIGLNPKQYFIDVKKEISKTSNSIPDTISDNKFIIVDHSPVMEAIYKINIISERRALFLLFNYLKNEFQYSKSIHKNVEHVVLISFNNTGLLECINSNIVSFKSKDEEFRFFDNYTLINANNLTTPFIYYRQTSIYIDINALSKIKKEVASIIKVAPPEPVDLTNISNEEPTTKNNTSKINNISSKPIGEDKLGSNVLHKTLTELEIHDDNIENNIRLAIQGQLSKNPNASEEDLNLIVLRAINKTIYGHDNISEEHLNNPKLLTSKLKAFDEYYDVMHMSSTENNYINPNSELISLNKITGPSRHKFEFSNNIHTHVEKLFKTLEDKTNPIEVLDIKHTIKDNNLNRYIEYEITLKNKVGFKEPYTIKLNVPHLINDRYFKLNGKEYILSSQQFLKPITKSTSTEARFLSHFNMITEKLVNFKYSPSDIPTLINYISRTYGSLVLKYSEADKRIEFHDGTLIDLDSDVPFSYGDLELVRELGKFHLYKNGKKIETDINRSEFLFTHLLNLINTVNPNDQLKNSTRSVQYVEIHLMGAHMPLILAIWQQIGLTDALIKFGLNFQITEELPELNKTSISIKLKDDNYLIVNPKSKREEYIANGLLKLPFIANLTASNLNERESSFEYLSHTYGTKILNNLDSMVETGIDPTTNELLKFENLPNNVIDIITGPLVDKLFNDDPDHPSDLNTLRVRMSEYMTQLMYTEINANRLTI